MNGRRSHWICYRNQFQWRVEQLGDPLTLSWYSSWNETTLPRHNAFTFCGAKYFKCWIFLFGRKINYWDFPVDLGPLDFCQCISNLNIKIVVVSLQSRCSRYTEVAHDLLFSKKKQQHENVIFLIHANHFSRNGSYRISNHS